MSVGKKNVILASILCVSIAVIGVSFAYFSSGVSVTGDGASATFNPGDMIKVSYDAGEALNMENAIPGDTEEKSFSVKVTPTDNENSTKYAIVLDISNNEFTGTNELTYVLKENGSEIKNGDLTTASGKTTLTTIEKTVSGATTYNYTLEVTFKNTDEEQNHNAGKKFISNLKVEFAEAN